MSVHSLNLFLAQRSRRDTEHSRLGVRLAFTHVSSFVALTTLNHSYETFGKRSDMTGDETVAKSNVINAYLTVHRLLTTSRCRTASKSYVS